MSEVAIARKALRSAGKDIRQRLDHFPSDRIEYLQQLEHNYGTVLTLIGKGLYGAAIAMGDPSLDFYFWPGYSTIFRERSSHQQDVLRTSARDIGDRITMRTHVPGFDHINCGVGYPGHPQQYKANHAAYWFHELLADNVPHEQLYTSSATPPLAFEPGGTHAWFQHNSPMTLESGGIFDTLVVTTLPNAEINMPDGHLAIHLDNATPIEWGSQIAMKLNSLPGRQRIRWPASDTLNAEDVLAETEAARQLLYSMWLLACFRKRWRTTSADMIAQAASTLRAMLPDRCRRLVPRSHDLSQALDEHVYDSWYTIQLEPAPIYGLDVATVSGEDEKAQAARTPGKSGQLGTAMILTSGILSPDYLELIRPWLQLQYLSLRHVESILEIETLSARTAAQVMAHSSASKIMILASEVSTQPGEGFSLLFRSTLWALQAEAHMHQGKAHNHAAPAFLRSGDIDPLHEYFELAVQQAIFRAGRNQDPAIQKAVHALMALQSEQRVDAFIELCAQPEVKDCDAVKESYGDTLRLESYCMMYVRCLYPALYHCLIDSIHRKPWANRRTIVSLTLANNRIVTTIYSHGDAPSGPVSDVGDIETYHAHFIGGPVPKPSHVYDNSAGLFSVTFMVPCALGRDNEQLPDLENG